MMKIFSVISVSTKILTFWGYNVLFNQRLHNVKYYFNNKSNILNHKHSKIKTKYIK